MLFLKSDTKLMDDIVFEGRNKSYGAYFLRRRYEKSMIIGILMGVIIFVFLIFLPVILDWVKSWSSPVEDPFIMTEVVLPLPSNIQSTIPLATATAKMQEKQSYSAVNKSTIPKVKKDEETVETPIIKTIVNPLDTANKNNDNQGAKGPSNENGLEEIVTFIHQMPMFPGCEDETIPYLQKKKCAEYKLQEFLKNNLRYPNLAVQKGTQGTVFAQFVVEKDGTISNIKILQDIGDGCGYEARRVIELMNTMTQRWTPGIQSNHPVRVQYTLPIVFQGRQ